VKRLRLATVSLGVILLCFSVFLGLWTGRQRAFESRDARLRAEVRTQEARVHSNFTRSQSILRIMAQNPNLAWLVGDPTSDMARESVTEDLAYLENLYPGQISETCLILRDGREIGRVTEALSAAPSELSADESKAVFFAPTFAGKFNEVYQSRPYRSPDTGRWVIANSILVPTASDVPEALLHFEVTIASNFGDSLGVGGGHIRLVDESGLVLIDTSAPKIVDPKRAPLGYPEQSQFRDLLRQNGSEVEVKNVGAERVATLAVSPVAGNTNRWLVVASAPSYVGWTAGIGPFALVLLVLGFLVLIVAWRTEKAHQDALRRLSLTDNLTGLGNRVLLRDRFEQTIRLARRNSHQAAVLMLDLDDFKEVNDTLGHHHGDQLLQLVTERLREVVREVDTLARLGGDEFAIVMPDVAGTGGAVALAERIGRVLTENYSLAGVPVHVGASIGIAVYPDHGESIEDLLQHADVAMYRAKKGGFDYAVFSTSDTDSTTRQLKLIAELRDAVYGDQLELHYQPKFDLSTQRFIGVEALVRWKHPELGLISPVEFIGAAERTGLIRQLTRWVLGTSLRQLSVWIADGADITLAVNISPRSLTDQSLFDDVLSALTEANVDPRRVILEVTETSFIAEPDRSIAALLDLQSLGLRVSIDDFGTGYSSLTYLRNLPVNEVKIDKSFVSGVTTNAADQSIVESTISLAHALGFTVVAEGIEDQATLDHLILLGCDVAQGFHLGRPVLPEGLPSMAPIAIATVG
jgi:diguanylate cyclase (GGDEF)-like protein